MTLTSMALALMLGQTETPKTALHVKALLIGYTKPITAPGVYSGAGLATLGGDVDVKSMKSALMNFFDVPSDSIKCLDTPATTTKKAILAGLDWLAKSVGPGDAAFVYISSHGTLVNISDKGLPGQALVPSDARFLPNSKSVIDPKSLLRRPEMEARLRDLRVVSKADQVVYIADACFSGGFASRGSSIPKVLKPAAVSIGVAEKLPEVTLGSGVVMMMAAGDREEASRPSILSEVSYFTEGLSKALTEKPVTYDDWFRNAYSRTRHLNYGQTPHIQEDDGMVIFGTGTRSTSGYRVYRVGSDWLVDAGQILGFRAGMSFVLRKGGKDVVKASLKNVQPSFSELELEQSKSVADLEGCRGISLDDMPPIPVALGMDPSIAKSLAGFSLPGQRTRAIGSKEDYHLKQTEGGVEIRNEFGELVDIRKDKPGASVEAQLKRIASDLTMAKFVKNMDALGDPTFRIEVRAVRSKVETVGGKPKCTALFPDEEVRNEIGASAFALQIRAVKISADKPAPDYVFVTIMNVDARDRVSQIWPQYESKADQMLPVTGKWHYSGNRLIPIDSKNLNVADLVVYQCWRGVSQAGLDTTKILASTTYQSFKIASARGARGGLKGNRITEYFDAFRDGVKAKSRSVTDQTEFAVGTFQIDPRSKEVPAAFAQYDDWWNATLFQEPLK